MVFRVNHAKGKFKDLLAKSRAAQKRLSVMQQPQLRRSVVAQQQQAVARRAPSERELATDGGDGGGGGGGGGSDGGDDHRAAREAVALWEWQATQIPELSAETADPQYAAELLQPQQPSASGAMSPQNTILFFQVYVACRRALVLTQDRACPVQPPPPICKVAPPIPAGQTPPFRRGASERGVSLFRLGRRNGGLLLFRLMGILAPDGWCFFSDYGRRVPMTPPHPLGIKQHKSMPLVRARYNELVEAEVLEVRYDHDTTRARGTAAFCAVHARLRFLNWDAPDDWAALWLARGATGGSLIVEGAVFSFDMTRPPSAPADGDGGDAPPERPSAGAFGLDVVFGRAGDCRSSHDSSSGGDGPSHTTNPLVERLAGGGQSQRLAQAPDALALL